MPILSRLRKIALLFFSFECVVFALPHLQPKLILSLGRLPSSMPCRLATDLMHTNTEGNGFGVVLLCCRL